MHPTFTPSALTADELDAITVGRATTFETLVKRLKGAVRDGSRPHTLIVAPRGAGKTHTLHVAVRRSLTDPDIAKSILPVFIPEDSLAIGTYIDLLVEIARSIDDGLAASAREMRRQKDTIGIEEGIITAADGRMILLAIENLDRVFEALGSGGQGALRAWVETSTAITIFATAPTLFTGVSSRSYPWYGSFMVESLPELTVDDAVVMLSKAARRSNDEELATFIESPQGRERLQVIHRLAGGSPRLWHILSEGIDIESLDALVPAVESLLDRLAPYYQQQLWQLPAGEQRLVVELARGWEPQTVTDLAAAVGISNQTAAAALGRLASSRWVTSTKAETGDKRASWYDLTEPLLRYHLQYRENRGKPLRLIVEFLRGFYSRERLLDELGKADPDSHLEHHLQFALLGGLSALPIPQDVGPLISGLRLWIAEDDRAISDAAMAAEYVASAASNQVSNRRLPNRLNAIAHQAAVAAAGADGSFAERFVTGLDVLTTSDWAEAGDDALLWLQLSWGRDLTPYEARRQRLLHSRRCNEPAVLLRAQSANKLLASSEPGATEAALTAFNALLDDLVEDETNHPTQAGTWIFWAKAAARSQKVPSRSAPDALEAAAGIVVAIQNEHADWPDIAKLLTAIVPGDREQVAARVALLAAERNMNPPEEFDPLQFASDEFQSLVHHLERQLASGKDVSELRP